MNSLRYAKGDFMMVVLICLIIGIGGYTFYQNSNVSDTVSYSSMQEDEEEEGAILDAAVKDGTEDEDVIFTPLDNDNLIETKYSLEQVYKSIENMEGKKETDINEELNNIYQDFYSYFPSSKPFMNMLGEKYTYDEYMFVKNYHVMRNNKEKFGFFLVTYSKCETFALLTNHSRQNKLKEYCD